MDRDDHVRRDQLLRSAVLGGDERAWQTWVDETFDPLYAYIRWRCGGLPETSEEIVQETWLLAVRRLRHFDPAQGGFLPWLRGIAANVLRNRLRRRETARKRRRPLEGEVAAADGREAALEGKERAERVMTVLGQLSPRHESVLRAKYLEGLSVAQIAQSWGETPKTIESLLTRARQSFRDAYRRCEKDGSLER